jgi:hypothetical protein
VQRHGLPATALDPELRGVDLPDEVHIEGRGGGRCAPVLSSDTGELVPLDVEKHDVGAARGCGDLVGHHGRDACGVCRESSTTRPRAWSSTPDSTIDCGHLAEADSMSPPPASALAGGRCGGVRGMDEGISTWVDRAAAARC